MAQRFMREWGVDEATARQLAQPYSPDAMGEHFFPRRWGTKLDVPKSVIDSPLNVLRPRGISTGEFFELHYRVDARAGGFAFGPDSAFRFTPTRYGLEKYDPLSKLWYGTPGPLKVAAVPTFTVAGFAGYADYQREQKTRQPEQPEGSR